MNTIIEKLAEMLVVPVVVLDDEKDAEMLADALVKGGLPCAEVTFRTAAAEESIRIMSTKYPDMLVGAGTVLTIEQVWRRVQSLSSARDLIRKSLTIVSKKRYRSFREWSLLPRQYRR